MNDSIFGRLRHAWNAFTTEREPATVSRDLFYGPSFGYRQDRSVYSFGNGRDTVSTIYNKLAIDVAANPIRHVRLNADGFFNGYIDSEFDQCLSVSTNIDQTPRAFFQDVCMTMFEEGVAAIVPVDTTLNPDTSGGYDIKTMRVGRVVGWYPSHVMVNVYNDRRGVREDVYLNKRNVAIVENPLYTIMNEPNSTLKRLMAKLALLDTFDSRAAAGKLDIIIQLPYVIRTDAKRSEAEKRRKEIEHQLTGSQHGIAYVDGTERITQLNRPAENNLLDQIDRLSEQLYSQLGLTTSVFDGTADANAMLNYYNRSIEPLVGAIVDAMHRTFLTKTARTKNQAILSLRDPFKLLPINDLIEASDKLITNRILTPNEIRPRLGYRPSEDEAANTLQNPNVDVKGDTAPQVTPAEDDAEDPVEITLPEEQQ